MLTDYVPTLSPISVVVLTVAIIHLFSTQMLMATEERICAAVVMKVFVVIWPPESVGTYLTRLLLLCVRMHPPIHSASVTAVITTIPSLSLTLTVMVSLIYFIVEIKVIPPEISGHKKWNFLLKKEEVLR